MATRNISPRANGEGSIGTSIKKWLAGWFGTVNATTVNTGAVVATGNVGAQTFTGDGSALTGIASGTGGVINTGSTTIGADSDANGSGEIALQTRGTTRVTVLNDGNVGVGTTGPGNLLHLYADATPGGEPLLKIENIAVDQYSQLQFTGTGRRYNIGVGNASESALGIANDFYIYDENAAAVRLVMDTSGNVGIGTVTPTAALHLKAGTAAANTAPLKLTAGTNLTTPENGAIEFDGTNLYITIGGVRQTIQVV